MTHTMAIYKISILYDIHSLCYISHEYHIFPWYMPYDMGDMLYTIYKLYNICNMIYTPGMNIYYMLYIAYEHDIHHNIRHIHIKFNMIHMTYNICYITWHILYVHCYIIYIYPKYFKNKYEIILHAIHIVIRHKTYMIYDTSNMI